jgi:hypothetical protein
MPANEAIRGVDVDDPSVLHDGYAVAQPLGLFHQMGRQEHRLASLADAAHQIPDRVPRLRVEAGGQLVEKHTSGSLINARAMNSRCFWPPERFMNQAPRLSERPSCSSSRFRIDGFLLVKRRPQIDCLPHFDSLLQLRLLKLNSDAVLQFVAPGEKGSRPSTAIVPPSGLRIPSMHSIVVVFPAPLGPISPKISPWFTLNDASSTATVLP